MSRDATGIYSAHAVRSSTCPVCRSGRGEPCNLDVPGYAEHGTHWERTETAPQFPPVDTPRAVAIEIASLFCKRLGLSEEAVFFNEELIRETSSWVKAAVDLDRAAQDAPLRAMQAAKAAAEKRIRDAFQETYGAFWKCRRCGGYIGARLERETEPRGYVCPYCGSTDNLAHGYSDARDTKK